MGKASSNKKVARAARAGGSRARAAGERNFLFPVALFLVVVLGTVLIVYARDNRSAGAQDQPVAFEDHWHAAYGFYICDHYLDPLPEFEAPNNGGTHTHGDGLFHIHPFSVARSGKNATVANFIKDAGTVLGGGSELSDDSLGIPGGKTYVEGKDTCEGVDGDPVVQIRYWDSEASAKAGDDPTVVTDNLDSVRFENDKMVFIVAFAPLDAEIPAPDSVSGLDNVSDVDPYTAETSTTVAGDTSTTVAGDTSTTTEAGTTDTTEPVTTTGGS